MNIQLKVSCCILLAIIVASSSRPVFAQSHAASFANAISELENERDHLIDPSDTKRLNHLIRVIREVRRARAAVTFDHISCDSNSIVYDKDLDLKNDTVISCEQVTLEKGVFIRLHGHTLFFDVDRLVLKENSSVDGRGMKGGNGAVGHSVEPPWNSQGDGDFRAALQQCRDNVNSPERGGQGEKGLAGSPGAIVILKTSPKTSDGRLPSIYVDGGEGGPGGGGGNGRLLRNGRNFYCDGCTMNCPAGQAGPQGDKGDDGQVVLL